MKDYGISNSAVLYDLFREKKIQPDVMFTWKEEGRVAFGAFVDGKLRGIRCEDTDDGEFQNKLSKCRGIVQRSIDFKEYVENGAIHHAS